MNKIIKYLEENNIEYSKYGQKCSPEIRKDLNFTLRLIKHEVRRNNGEYSRV